MWTRLARPTAESKSSQDLAREAGLDEHDRAPQQEPSSSSRNTLGVDAPRMPANDCAGRLFSMATAGDTYQLLEDQVAFALFGNRTLSTANYFVSDREEQRQQNPDAEPFDPKTIFKA